MWIERRNPADSSQSWPFYLIINYSIGFAQKAHVTVNIANIGKEVIYEIVNYFDWAARLRKDYSD